MPTKKPGTKSNWTDPDDAPALTRDWFARAEFREGERLVRVARPLGRPRKDSPKTAVSLRLDRDVLAHFKASGPGWQTRINEALRKAAGL